MLAAGVWALDQATGASVDAHGAHVSTLLIKSAAVGRSLRSASSFRRAPASGDTVRCS